MNQNAISISLFAVHVLWTFHSCCESFCLKWKKKITLWNLSDEIFEIDYYKDIVNLKLNIIWLAFNFMDTRGEYKFDTSLYNFGVTHENVQWVASYN